MLPCNSGQESESGSAARSTTMGRAGSRLFEPGPPGAVKQHALAAAAQTSRLGRKLHLIAFKQRIGQCFKHTQGFFLKRAVSVCAFRVRRVVGFPGPTLRKIPIAARRMGPDGTGLLGISVLRNNGSLISASSRCAKSSAVAGLGTVSVCTPSASTRLSRARLLSARPL